MKNPCCHAHIRLCACAPAPTPTPTVANLCTSSPKRLPPSEPVCLLIYAPTPPPPSPKQTCAYMRLHIYPRRPSFHLLVNLCAYASTNPPRANLCGTHKRLRNYAATRQPPTPLRICAPTPLKTPTLQTNQYLPALTYPTPTACEPVRICNYVPYSP